MEKLKQEDKVTDRTIFKEIIFQTWKLRHSEQYTFVSSPWKPGNICRCCTLLHKANIQYSEAWPSPESHISLFVLHFYLFSSLVTRSAKDDITSPNKLETSPSSRSSSQLALNLLWVNKQLGIIASNGGSGNIRAGARGGCKTLCSKTSSFRPEVASVAGLLWWPFLVLTDLLLLSGHLPQRKPAMD